MSERELKFRLGQLDLVLLPRLDVDDFKYLKSLCGKMTYTFDEDEPVSDRLADMLVKCARDHDPTLTKERILDEFVMPIHKLNQAVAITLLEVSGVIQWPPTIN
jgi:hypothetical protein